MKYYSLLGMLNYKQIGFWLALYLASSYAYAQTRIPDQNFAVAIHNACNSCIDPGTNTLLPPAATLTTLNVSNKKIADLTGIEGFTNLQTLKCDSNSLVTLPTLPNKLTILWCINNQLTALPTLPSSLQLLYCYANQLTSLPQLPNALQQIYFYNNKVTNIPSLPNGLTSLGCGGNPIKTLPILPTSLQTLYCFGNDLTNLPALPEGLLYLYCQSNSITCLPTLPNSLQRLNITNTLITCIPNTVSRLEVGDYTNTWIIKPTPPICTTPCNISTTPANGLVAYYPFNGNANDEIGSAIHGINNGGTFVNDRFCNALKAIQFNGSSWVDIGPTLQNNLFTINFWVYVPVLPSTGTNYALISKLDNNAPNLFKNYEIYLQPNGKINIITAGGSIWNNFISTNTLQTNQWTMLTLCYNGSLASFYVNGVLDASLSISYVHSNVKTVFGRRAGPYNPLDNIYYNGVLDDIRFYNRALSNEEVKQIYDLEKPPTLAIPTATLSGNQTINAGQSASLIVTLTGTGPWDITLSDGQKYTASASPYSISVKPTATTTYTLTSVKTACNTGTASGSAVVTVNACKLSVKIDGKIKICEGPSPITANITAGGQKPYTYYWSQIAVSPTSPGGISVTSFYKDSSTINAYPNGGPGIAGRTYRVYVQDAKGCISDTASFSPIQLAKPPTEPSIAFSGYVKLGSVGNIPICEGQNLTLLPITSWAETYSWKLDGVEISKNTQLSVNKAGNYTLTYITQECGSTTSPTTIVSINPLPIINLTNQNLSGLDTFTPNNIISSGTAPYTYSWSSTPSVIFSSNTIANPIIGPFNQPSTTISLSIEDKFGCTASKSITVNWQPCTPPTAAVTADKPLLCDGISLILTATGGSTGYTYQWKKDGSIIAGATASTYTTSATGDYSVSITDTKACVGNSSVLKITKTNPTASITGKPDFCVGSGTILTITYQSVAGKPQIQWKKDGVNVSSDLALSQWYATKSGSYAVEIIDANGCKATSTAMTITEKGSDIVSVVKPDGPITVYAPNTATLSATLGYEKDPRFKYQWRKDGKDIAGATGYVYEVSSSGSYAATISDADCAVTSVEVKVTVLVPMAVQLNATDELRIYPNPTDGWLVVSAHLQKSSILALKLLDIEGRSIATFELTNQHEFEKTIDISQYPTGSYIIEIVGKDLLKRVKIFKE